MVLRRFRRIAKSVAKRAVKEIAKRALDESPVDSRPSQDQPAPASEPKPAPHVPTTEQSRLSPTENQFSGTVTKPSGEARSTSNSTAKVRSTRAKKKKSPAGKRVSKAAVQTPEREPLPTRTMARLLMKQERWARALLIYDQLQQERSPSGAVADLALAAERMTAYHALAEEEEAPITWRHLRRDGDQLRLHVPRAREEDRSFERPVHLAILRFDRRPLVEWEVQRDDRVATGPDFSFVPGRAGDYAVAAVDRDGALVWVTPIFEWHETDASIDR